MFLSETGLVGFALGMGGLVSLGAAALARVRAARGIERSSRLVLLAAFAAWSVESVYDWHWEIPAVTIAALVAIGVAAAPSPVGSSRGRMAALPARPAAMAALAALAAVAVVVSAYLPAAAEDKRLDALTVASRKSGDLASAVEEADLAHRLNPLAVEPLFTASALAERAGDPQRSLELLRQAAQIQPDNRQTWQRLVTAYAAAGYLDEAADAFSKAIRADPFQSGDSSGQLRAGDFTRLYPPSSSPTAFGTPSP